MNAANNDGQNKKRRTKKTKEQRETKWEQQYMQLWEVENFTSISLSKIKKAIKNKELKSDQACERGMHLCHIDEVNRWLTGIKGR
jgi:hypothetical protein